MTVNGANEAAFGPASAGGSIRLRLTLGLVGVSVLTLVAVGLLFYGFIGNYVLQQKQEAMLGHAVEVTDQVESLFALDSLGTMGMSRALGTLLRIDMQVLPQGAGITIFAGTRVLAASGPPRTQGPLAALLLPEAQKLTAEGPAATTLRLEGDQRLVVASAPVDLGTLGDGLVVVSLPTTDAVAERVGLFRILLVSALVGVGLALVVGLALGNWLTRPLKRLSRAAGTMASGSYAEPITGSYPTEVFELASSLEEMRREVRHSDESLRGFVASAAHELRTPLTSIQGFSQALLDGTADTPEQRRRSAAAVFRESSRLRRLVEALLTLSRFDSREFRPAAVRVDARVLVLEEVDRLAEAGLVEPERVRVGPEEAPVLLVTDPDMLRQVVANLLRNAAQYGGSDPIAVRLHAGDGSVRLDVQNGGESLAPEERDRVFARFFRGRSGVRQEGFGLGLPLVREICEVLGGTVELLDSGEGTTFRVTLPRSTSDSPESAAE
ncbi:MAG: sensor histidine kinase [Thermoleophilia bacterium]